MLLTILKVAYISPISPLDPIDRSITQLGLRGVFKSLSFFMVTGGALPNSESGKTGKIEFYTKSGFLVIQVEIGEV